MTLPLNDIKRINDILINWPPANDESTEWDFDDEDEIPVEGDEDYGYYNDDDEWIWY